MTGRGIFDGDPSTVASFLRKGPGIFDGIEPSGDNNKSSVCVAISEHDLRWLSSDCKELVLEETDSVSEEKNPSAGFDAGE